MKSFHSLRFLSLYILILATIVLVGCTPNAPFLISEPEATAEVVPTIAPTPVLEAMVTFRVELPEPLPPGTRSI
jgi:hypothetical protein